MIRKKQLKWYVAVLVVECRVDDGLSDDPLVDLQYRLVRASNHEAAYRRALELGRKERVSYKNADGANVRWRFVGLNDLCELLDSRLRHGVEVYSMLREVASKQFVRRKKELTVFWHHANRHKTAAEILDA